MASVTARVRNAQNAADAGSLAGASTLREVKQGTKSPPQVLATVISVAEDNGADAGDVKCEIVNPRYATTRSSADVIGPCTTSNVQSPAAAGVRVTTHDTRKVPFGAFADSDRIKGDAVAAATVQPVREGKSPFMVCADPSASGHPAPVLNPSTTDPSGYVVNPAALGLQYVLHGNAMKDGGRMCQGPNPVSNSWRGYVSFSGTFPVPSPNPNDDTDWWQVKTGNANGHLDRVLTGDDACEGDVDDIIGCRLAIPLCPKTNMQGGTNLRLFCVKMGAFEITWHYKHPVGPPPCNGGVADNGLLCGKYLGAANASRGRGGADVADPNAVVVIKLVQ